MSHEEIEDLSRGGKSYAVAEAILNLALHDCERLVKATKRDMPRILADQFRRENENFRKLLGK